MNEKEFITKREYTRNTYETIDTSLGYSCDDKDIQVNFSVFNDREFNHEWGEIKTTAEKAFELSKESKETMLEYLNSLGYVIRDNELYRCDDTSGTFFELQSELEDFSDRIILLYEKINPSKCNWLITKCMYSAKDVDEYFKKATSEMKKFFDKRMEIETFVEYFNEKGLGIKFEKDCYRVNVFARYHLPEPPKTVEKYDPDMCYDKAP